MTATLERPAPPQPAAAGPPPSVVALAATGAAAAAGLSLLTVSVLVLLAWVTAADAGATATEALRVAAQIWLAAHRVTLELPQGSFTLAPLGLTLLAGYGVYRAGGWVARVAVVRSLARAIFATLAMAASYGVVVALVTGAAATTVRPEPVSALVAGWLMGLTAGGLGVLRGSGLWADAVARIPAPVRAVMAGGFAAVAALVAAGAALVALSLGWHFGRTVELARALDTGLAGGFVLLGIGLVYLPTAAVWGAAFALGPGFAVGTGTSVGPFGVELGAVPAMPLLAALPGNGDGPSFSVVTVVAPFVAGVVGGVVLARRLHDCSPGRTAAWGLCVGVAGGAVLLVLAMLAGGHAGPGRFTAVGPSPWQVGLAATVDLALAAALGAWQARRRQWLSAPAGRRSAR